MDERRYDEEDTLHVVGNVICIEDTDIGGERKCGAYLTGLKRTRIGEYKVENAMTVDDFMENLNRFETN